MARCFLPQFPVFALTWILCCNVHAVTVGNEKTRFPHPTFEGVSGIRDGENSRPPSYRQDLCNRADQGRSGNITLHDGLELRPLMRAGGLFSFPHPTFVGVSAIRVGENSPWPRPPSYRQDLSNRADQVRSGNMTLRDTLRGLELRPLMRVGGFLDETGIDPGLLAVLVDELPQRAGFSWRNSSGVVHALPQRPSNATHVEDVTFSDLLICSTESFDIPPYRRKRQRTGSNIQVVDGSEPTSTGRKLKAGKRAGSELVGGLEHVDDPQMTLNQMAGTFILHFWVTVVAIAMGYISKYWKRFNNSGAIDKLIDREMDGSSKYLNRRWRTRQSDDKNTTSTPSSSPKGDSTNTVIMNKNSIIYQNRQRQTVQAPVMNEDQCRDGDNAAMTPTNWRLMQKELQEKREELQRSFRKLRKGCDKHATAHKSFALAQ